MKQVSTSTTRPVQLGGETMIERPNIGGAGDSHVTRVPLGKAVIVGGMTVEPG